MKLLLDACVLYPTVLREILIGTAQTGAYNPVWSDRILEEWARAAARQGAESEGIARAEIALLRANWPVAGIVPAPDAEQFLSLPDMNDLHVLAAALEAGARGIVTLNLRDFPTRTMAHHGLEVRSPDSLLLELASEDDRVATVVEDVRKRTEQISGREQPLRPLLKRAGLPRLGKMLSAS